MRDTTTVESTNGTVDIDHQHPDFIADRHGRYRELRARCPVVYNTAYGGFWLVTDYESVAAVARDNETFAHRFDPDSEDGIAYKGICGIPDPREPHGWACRRSTDPTTPTSGGYSTRT